MVFSFASKNLTEVAEKLGDRTQQLLVFRNN